MAGMPPLRWSPSGVQVQKSWAPLTQGLVHQLRAMRQRQCSCTPSEGDAKTPTEKNQQFSIAENPELFPHLKNRGSLYLLSLQWELSEITFTKSPARLCRYSINGGYY